ncbi:MAG: hypothetical protein A2017_07905 [Lentisphaerae bacterium GWF2_44_16]|nr:MAG: hypothetical protein A2017_07905 [Lentisphaerae bacterium GWF2_44_16]
MNEKIIITKAVSSDLPEILEVQKQAFHTEAVFYNDFNIQPMKQTLEEISEEFKSKVFLKASIDGRIVASVRASRSLENEKICFIEKLFVHPDFRKRGIADKLLSAIQEHFPEAASFELGTGKLSAGNIRLYEKAGFRIYGEKTSSPCGVSMVLMRKNKSQKNS